MPSFHPGTAICRTRIAVGILKHPIPRERRVVHVGGHRIDVTSKEVFVRRNSFIDATGRAVAGAVKWRSTIAQIAGRAAGTEFKGQAKPLDGVIRNRGLQNARLHGTGAAAGTAAAAAGERAPSPAGRGCRPGWASHRRRCRRPARSSPAR